MPSSTADVTVKTADEAARLPPSTRAEIDAALAALASGKQRWTKVSPQQRHEILSELLESFGEVAARWADACIEAEGIPPANPLAGEEWLAGPYLVCRNLRLLRDSLRDIAAGRRPRIPGGVKAGPAGQAIAHVFPGSNYDRIFYPGVTAEVWMEPGITPAALPETQAVHYFGDRTPSSGRLGLVLGAGNVSSIGPMDALYKLFVENEAVLFKAHPVNDYLGPLLVEGFAPLVERDVLRVVYGGAAEGEYLCHHPAVESIHITGSDRTVEAIAFGPGPEGARRKAARTPLLDKPISSELGNVSPVIVVPGAWSRGDHAYQAENLASMLTNNAGFNCNAARLILTHASWPGRRDLLAALRRVLASVPTRRAYYPGAGERWQRFVDAHPQTETFGDERFGRLPWAFIPDLDPEEAGDLCFTTESFAPVFAEVAIEAADAAEFVDRATAFANERLWGRLNATLIVDRSGADEPTRAAVERAVARLRYGTVSINHWAAVGYGLVVTPWGAFPGSDLYDIQSGSGWVHNTLMFDRPEKSVVRSLFRAVPKPPWFTSHKTALPLARALTEFELAPSPAKLPGIFRHALLG